MNIRYENSSKEDHQEDPDEVENMEDFSTPSQPNRVFRKIPSNYNNNGQITTKTEDKGEKDKEKKLPDPINIDNLKMRSAVRLEIHGVEIFFPYQPYDCQIAYMVSVIETLMGKKNALLQSPTGTGKTLCLLCAALGFLKYYRDRVQKNPQLLDTEGNIKIIYCSRTHSQLKQVVKELKSSPYRPITSMLGSRDQMCVKAEFQGLTGTMLNANCKKARQSKFQDHKCAYYDQFVKNESQILNRFSNRVVDVEELNELGKINLFCPYFFERKVEKKADIIFMPYNYLLDGKIRGIMDISLANGIVIFDEAHNIEQVCEDGCSIELSLRDLESCENDEKLLQKEINERGDEIGITEEMVEDVMRPVKNLKKSFVQWRKDLLERFQHSNDRFQEKGEVLEGNMIFALFKERTAEQYTSNKKQMGLDAKPLKFNSGLNENNMPEYLSLIEKVCEVLGTSTSSRGGLDLFWYCVATVAGLWKQDLLLRKPENTNEDWMKNHINSYNLYVKIDKDDSTNFILHFWCMNPGVGFGNILGCKPRSILLTSGTLAPLKSFEAELQTEFPIQLLNKHVIDTRKQCQTFIYKTGPAGKPFRFDYNNRGNDDMCEEAGRAINYLAKIVPNGLLVFFSSYTTMKKCMDAWEANDILKNINEHKTTYVEPKSSAHMKKVMAEFSKEAKRKGAILFGVCRAKASEGIDFADELARAVILIGVPYPAAFDKKIELKKKYLNESTSKIKGKTLSGNEWYMQQTIRAANQAMGRSIRHITDFGMIFLLDERFAQNDFMNGYPQWIKDNCEVHTKFGFTIPKILNFFKDRHKPAGLDRIINNNQQMNQIRVFGNNNTININFPATASAQLTQLETTQSTQLSENSQATFMSAKKILERGQNMNQNIKPIGNNTPKPLIYQHPPNQQHILEPVSDNIIEEKINENSLFDSMSEQLEKVNQEEPKNFYDLVTQKSLKRKLANDTPPLTNIKSLKPNDEAATKKRIEFLSNFTNNHEPLVTDAVSPFASMVNSLPGNNPPLRLNRGLFNLGTPQKPIVNNNKTPDSFFKNSQTSDKPKSTVSIVIKDNDNDEILEIPVDEEDQAEIMKQLHHSVLSRENTGNILLADTHLPLTGSDHSQKLPGDEAIIDPKKPVTCMICYEDTSTKTFQVAKCGHMACMECWGNCLSLKLECPMCKRRVRTKGLTTMRFN
jgi:regulator of telomere elongation helicase 1